MNLKLRYLGFKIQNLRYQPGGNSRRVANGLGSLMKTSVGPLPIKHSNHDQGVKDWVPQLFHVHQTEFFGHLAVVCPKLVIGVQLQEHVILPSELSLDWSMVLLPWKNHSMKTTLGDLKQHLGKMATHHHFQDTYLIWCQIRLVGIDCWSQIGGVVKPSYLFMLPRSRAVELWTSNSMSIVEGHSDKEDELL